MKPKAILEPNWWIRCYFILLISKQYKYIFCNKKIQINHIQSYKIKSIKKIPFFILNLLIDSIFLSEESIRDFFSQHTHRQIKKIFKLGASSVISDQISQFKMLTNDNKNNGILTCAIFWALALRTKTNLISNYWAVLLSSHCRNIRFELKEIRPDHLSEVKLALDFIGDKKIISFKPSSYEILISIIVNSLPDIGRILSRSPQGLDLPKAKNFLDLASKLNRRWLFRYETNKTIVNPHWLNYLHGKSYAEYKLEVAFETQQIYGWSVAMENCLHAFVKPVLEQSMHFVMVKTFNDKIKWAVQINEDGTIVEIKGKYNAKVCPMDQFYLQNFIYKMMKAGV